MFRKHQLQAHRSMSGSGLAPYETKNMADEKVGFTSEGLNEKDLDQRGGRGGGSSGQLFDQSMATFYREGHLLANLGWVEFDLGCSTILPTCSATSAKFPSAQAELGRGWKSINQSQPIPGSPADASSCTVAPFAR